MTVRGVMSLFDPMKPPMSKKSYKVTQVTRKKGTYIHVKKIFKTEMSLVCACEKTCNFVTDAQNPLLMRLSRLHAKVTAGNF